jgi:uncharacterized protein (TIGR03032 family)
MKRQSGERSPFMKLASEFTPIPLRFDVARLVEEICAFTESEWRPDGQQPRMKSTLPLVAPEPSGRMLPTSLLERSPYLRQVVASFDSAVGLTRLVRVAGPSEPRPHIHAGSYWLRHVRIHLPIVAHAAVRFVCGETSLPMEPGEPWMFDTWRPHTVIDPEAATRIHLVVDTVGSAAFWSLVSTPRRPHLVPYDPEKRVGVRTEAAIHDSTRSPYEQEELLDLVLDSLPADGDLTRVIRRESRRFVDDWRSLCVELDGDAQRLVHLTSLRERVDERLGAYEGAVTLPNGVDAATIIRAIINSDSVTANTTGSIVSATAKSVEAPRVSRLSAPALKTVNVQSDEPPIRGVATENFAQILQTHGFSLAVSTGKLGRVTLLRASSATKLQMTNRSFKSPFGIAVRGDQMVIGTERELWDFRNEFAAARKLSVQHDAGFLPRSAWHTGAIYVHEVAFAGDELWFVNTLFSTLCTLDGQHSFVPRWRPSFIASPAPDDACHLNGMAVSNGRVRLVTAFAETSTRMRWREQIHEAGVLIDVDSGEVAVRGLALPHSPRLHVGVAYVLESSKGTLAVADLDRGSVEVVAELPGFTRGLALAGPYAFVGLSHARPSANEKMPLFGRVSETECGIQAIDLRTGHVAGFFRFESGVTEIFDVQVLPWRCPELLEPRSTIAGTTYAFPTLEPLCSERAAPD